MTQRPKRYEELTFADDYMFCKILQNEQDLCKELVEIILDRKIGKIVETEKQKSIEITSDGRGVRFDVYLEDDTDSMYDIEMQKTDSKKLPRRSRYYQGMLDLNQMERRAKFSELKKSVIIFICLENPFEDYGLHKYSFYPACREADGLELEDGTSRIFLSAQGDKDDISSELKALLNYIAGKAPESDFTKRLDDQVKRYREHEEWRAEYMTLLERDELMREEGRAEERVRTEEEARRADAEKERADAEKERADAEKERADAEKERADAENERANAAEERVRQLEKLLVETEYAK